MKPHFKILFATLAALAFSLCRSPAPIINPPLPGSSGAGAKIYVSTSGNDANRLARNNSSRPVKTLYDFASNGTPIGALAWARSGEQVILLDGTYLAPVFPVGAGVRVFATNAIIIRTNRFTGITNVIDQFNNTTFFTFGQGASINGLTFVTTNLTIGGQYGALLVHKETPPVYADGTGPLPPDDVDGSIRTFIGGLPTTNLWTYYDPTNRLTDSYGSATLTGCKFFCSNDVIYPLTQWYGNVARVGYTNDAYYWRTNEDEDLYHAWTNMTWTYYTNSRPAKQVLTLISNTVDCYWDHVFLQGYGVELVSRGNTFVSHPDASGQSANGFKILTGARVTDYGSTVTCRTNGVNLNGNAVVLSGADATLNCYGTSFVVRSNLTFASISGARARLNGDWFNGLNGDHFYAGFTNLPIGILTNPATAALLAFTNRTGIIYGKP